MKDLWKVVKRYVREIQAADGALIVDDSIAEKPPTQTVTTQSKHFFTSLCAYIRLEMLKVTTQTHHFALKSKLHLCALRHGF